MRRHTLTALAACLVLSAAASCGGTQGSPLAGSETSSLQANGGGLPAFYSLDELRRASSDNLVLGQDTLDRSANAVDSGTALDLRSAGGLEFGLYGLAPGGALLQLSAELQIEPGEEAWIALANYAQGSWEIQGPYTEADGSPLFALNGADYLSGSGLFYCAVLVSDSHHATVVQLTISDDFVAPPPNELPVAALEATPEDLWAGENIHLDASAGTDGDGLIVKYEFDTDGDGVFEVDTGATAAYDFAAPALDGLLRPAVRVTDDAGGSSEAEDAVLVRLHGWRNSLDPDQDLDVGRFNSAAIVNGNPAVAYADNNSGDLMFVHASEPDGGAWEEPQVLDNSGVVFYTSLAVVNGVPAIAYYEDVGANLKYMVAMDADGIAWFPPQTLDGAGQVGEYPSLAVVSGNPAIAFFDQTNSNLKYIRAVDPNGLAWAPPQTIDAAGALGSHAALREVMGKPAVAYYDAGAGDLLYLRALDPVGAAWGPHQVLDPGGDVGKYTTMLIVGGNPAVSYYSAGDGALKYVRANTPDGLFWGGPQVVDAAGDVGRYASMALVGGKPALSYFDQTNGALVYVSAQDPLGLLWNAPLAADAAAVTGLFTALVEADGAPGIAYHDNNCGHLRYVRLQ